MDFHGIGHILPWISGFVLYGGIGFCFNKQ